MNIGYRLGDLAKHCSCQLVGSPERFIRDVCTLQNGKPDAISFLANRRYAKYLPQTQAAAVIVRQLDVKHSPVDCLVHDNPYVCYARIAKLLSGEKPKIAFIDPSAVIDSSATLGERVYIGANSYIAQQVKIAKDSYIGPGCVILDGVEMGSGACLHANVTIYPHCLIGKNSLLHAGVVVGSDGFGIAKENGKWIKIPQTGRVVIGDEVEIGAGTTIDRGAIDDTVIANGVKLDNQIQIAHNVRVGEHSAIAGCVGIAGSTGIGQRCTIAGGALILGHLELTDDVHITAGSLVAKSINQPGTYSSGTLIQNNMTWKRNAIRFSQLDDMAKRIQHLEKHIKLQKP